MLDALGNTSGIRNHHSSSSSSSAVAVLGVPPDIPAANAPPIKCEQLIDVFLHRHLGLSLGADLGETVSVLQKV